MQAANMTLISVSVTLLSITDRRITEGKSPPPLAHQIRLTRIALDVFIWTGSNYFVIAGALGRG